MVRVNLLKTNSLSDQHLIAEYNEILMLVAYLKKYKSLLDIPKEYCLGKGHMKFFKDKVLYLVERHEKLKTEMRKRNFVTNKKIDLKGFDKKQLNNWKPVKKDKEIIKKRIIEKLNKKTDFYRYYGEVKKPKFFIELINQNWFLSK